jgi:Ribosomal protein S8
VVFWPCVGYIGEFTVVDDHRNGKIVVNLIGRVNKCGCISPRFDISAGDYEKWVANLLPSRQFGFIVVTTSSGIMTHDEARRKGLGGKVPNDLFLSCDSRAVTCSTTGLFLCVCVCDSLLFNAGPGLSLCFSYYIILSLVRFLATCTKESEPPKHTYIKKTLKKKKTNCDCVLGVWGGGC